MQGLGKHAQAPRPDNEKGLERNQENGGTYTQERGTLLLPAFLDLSGRFHRESRLP